MTNTDPFVMVPITFKCPSRLLDKVREYATREDRDISSVCRKALARLVDADVKVRRRGRPKGGQKVRCL